MKLTVLGSGSFISGPERATAGFAVEMRNQVLIVDFGYGCLKRFQAAGIEVGKVSDFFITHFEHLDHVSDLAAFIFLKKAMIENKLSGKSQLNLFGGPGFKAFVAKLFDAFPFLQELPFNLNVSELDAFCTKKFPNFVLVTKQMKHRPSSIGLRFEENGKSVVFSGDTELNENLVDLAKDTNLLVIECSYAAKKPIWGHLSAEQAGEIAARANAKAVLLHHFLPETEKEDLKAIVAKKFKGKIYIAEDLMQVKV